MIIVVKADGSTFVTAANLGYGSTVHEISVIAPFTNGTMTIAFDLPSGTLLEPKLCTPAAATGEDFGVWTIQMTADITAESGAIGYQIAITDQYGAIFTTSRGTINVTGGISTILPAIPGSTTYTDILAVLSAINTNYQAVMTAIGADDDEASATGSIYARIAKAVADIATLDSEKVDTASIVNDLTTGGTTVPLSAEQGKVLQANKVNKTDIVNDLTTGGTAVPLSAEQGKTLQTNKVNTADIVNDLTTGGTAVPLSAEQGKALKTALGASGDAANATGTVYARVAYNKGKAEAAFVNIAYNATTGVITVTANDGSTKTIDLPMELLISSGEYDEESKDLVLTLANGQTIAIPLDEITSALVTQINAKADKVTGATSGNLAGLDANGNLTDSGKSVAALEASEDNAEAWAVGTVGGVAVESSADQYENNAKYYSDLAATAKEGAEAAQAAIEESAATIDEHTVSLADHDRRIDTAEKVISELNPNGESRVAVSGYGALSLPKNAAQGGLTGNVNGMTLTPLAFGDDVAVSGTLAFNSVLNNKYYDSLHKTVLTGTGSEMTVTNDTAAVADIAVYDLNAFGLQAVTDVNCAKMIPATMSGTKSSLVTRVRSVGKNLFDKSQTYLKNTASISTQTDTGIRVTNSDVGSYRRVAYQRKVVPGMAYKLSYTATEVSGAQTSKCNVFVIDDAGATPTGAIGTWLGHESGTGAKTISFTSPSSGAVWIIFFSSYETAVACTTEYASVHLGLDATYEAYRENSAYLEPLPMNRVPNGTVDSYNLLTRAHTQRIKRYVLTANNITALNIRTNVQQIVIQKPADSKMYNNSSSAADATAYISGFPEVSYDAEMASTTGIDYGASTTIIPLVVPLNTYADLAAAKTALTGTVIYYQLAEASYIVTEYAVTGNLIGYPSGTIYFEKALADAGMYSSGISILRTGYPITALETIQKVNADGTLTSLATASATIAGDGLSFTHTGLTDGDIVFFVYTHTAESVNGSNTINYLDSRFVLADTTNGKYYTYKPVITNGAIASWTVTEVS